jgi:hypothetical protein
LKTSKQEIEVTERAALAARFVNSTNSHIFLTGKAGTGKTTFLRELSRSTHKRHVILAPTGIAALNANGVTIHSQFLLPFGTFIPGRDFPAGIQDGMNFYTEQILARKHPLNAKRREVLRNIDLLIIDEVSMLRADLLDAIDYRMRSVKRNYQQRFGGVQVLMIGDLYQLPPVVKDHEWNVMSQYYRSPHFFESAGLRENGFVYIELDKIFRQQNSDFISILNNLRNNVATQADIDALNQHYQENAKAEEGTVTITTHNNAADKLNREALDKLKGKSHYFQAEVDQDFPERIFPVAESLELKEYAQIMFMKNDSQEGKYFNGKIAKVISIDDEDIEVEFNDGSGTMILRREKWENKKYSVNEKSKEMEEDVVGTFHQFPVKLAWAITVHKSQGLTFEKAVIDVGRAFAPGQVYVALSRLTSLDGLILKTKIQQGVISSDAQVKVFTDAQEVQKRLPIILHEKQADFLRSTLRNSFGFDDILKQIDHIFQKNDPAQFEDEEMRSALDHLKDKFSMEQANMEKFRIQIEHLIYTNEKESLAERAIKASKYYQTFLLKVLKELMIHIGEVELLSKTKTYRSALSELDLLVMKKLEEVEKSEYMVDCILNSKDVESQPELDKERLRARERIIDSVDQYLKENPKTSGLKSGRKRKKKGEPKAETGATYEETYNLVNAGFSIDQISEKRGLKASTLEGHFSKGLRDGRIKIDKVLSKTHIETLSKFFHDNKGIQLTGAFGKLKGKFSFGQLRMMQSHMAFMAEE